jgi:hypothetical protein
MIAQSYYPDNRKATDATVKLLMQIGEDIARRFPRKNGCAQTARSP